MSSWAEPVGHGTRATGCAREVASLQTVIQAARLRPEPARAHAAVPSRRHLSTREVWALAAVAGLLAFLYATNFGAIRAATGAEGSRMFAVYPLFFALVFLLYLAGVRLTWFAGCRVAVAVILLGVVFRLCMLPTPVVLSSDVYRYFWDGRVQLAGINPYRHPPEAQELATLRDGDIHPRINRPWARTVYPPGAQLLFAGVALTAPDRLWALRALVTMCEVVTMLVLLVLLRRIGLPEGRVTVYAWAPLPVFEFAQAGHIDAVVIPMVLGAVLAAGAGRLNLAGGLLGAAALIKLYPAIVLPVLWKRGDVRLPAAFLATVVLGYLPYAWNIGWRVVGFLPVYFTRFEDFNIGLRTLLTDGIGLTGTPARFVVSGFLVLALLWVLVALRRRRGDTLPDLTVAGGAAVMAYLLLVPSTIHPWYVGWLIPFLVILRNPGGWYFTGAVALSYVAYIAEPSRVPVWAVLVEYLPAYVAVVLGLLHARPTRERSLRTSSPSHGVP